MINSGDDYIVNPQDSVVINPANNPNKASILKIIRKKNHFFNSLGVYSLIAVFSIIITLYISNNNQLTNIISLVNVMKKEIKELQDEIVNEVHREINNKNKILKYEIDSSVSQIKKEIKDNHKTLNNEISILNGDITRSFKKINSFLLIDAPFGIQNYVHVSKFTASGFSFVYNKPYSHYTISSEMDKIKNSCSPKTILCIGGRDSENDRLVLVACDLCSVVLAKTAKNTPNFHNGVYWYNTPDLSIGFYTDVGDLSNNQRLSWKLDTIGGWLLGSLEADNPSGLSQNNRYYKIILKRDYYKY